MGTPDQAELMESALPCPSRVSEINPVKISGYAGFVSNIASKNVVGSNWELTQQSARSLPDHTMRVKPRIDTHASSCLNQSTAPPAARPIRGATQRLPGYAGYVPKIYARNIYAGTFEVCQDLAKQ